MMKSKKSIKNPFCGLRKSKNANLVSDLPQEPEELSGPIEKNLDIILKTAQLEYQLIAFNTWATQSSRLHTYLWLTVAVVSAQMAFFFRIFDASALGGMVKISFGCLLVAVAAGFIAFILGVDCMRGRGNVVRPIYGDYSYMISVAEWDRGGLRVRREAISALEGSINGHVANVDKLGKRMRVLSMLNLVSASFGAASCMFYFFPKIRVLF